MRRKNDLITDRQHIKSILEKNQILHMGLVDGDEPYVLPMNYGLFMDGDKCVFYFHSSKEGRKLDILARNPKVCLETSHLRPKPLGQENTHGQSYQCVIATGKVAMVDDVNEKIAAINLLRAHAGKPERQTTPEHANKVCIFKVEADSLVCKER